MPQGGFFEEKRTSPTSLAIVVLLHGVALTALAMSKMDVGPIFKPVGTEIFTVTPPPEPEPIPDPPEAKAEPQAPSNMDVLPPIVDIPMPKGPIVIADPSPPIPTFDIRPPGTLDVKPADPPAPVRVDARRHPSSELQPPYPASEERAGAEGKVVIRVTIGADGRVKAAQKVAAPNDVFYRATERHALRAWKFRAATLDGKPVESVKTLTVVFRLND